MKTKTNQHRMSITRKLAALVVANIIALPLMSGIVQAQVTTGQDRTVITLDVTNSCTTQITDTLGAGGVRGDDQELHDEDDTATGPLGDGFDQGLPSPTTDFTDEDFSNLTVASFDPAGKNIVVHDPEGGDDEAVAGHGYVDLELFDDAGNQYAAEFNAEVTCDTVNGYDLHIADTFNLETTASGAAPVDYDDNDIQTATEFNLNKREGLFRIAPDSLRDITTSSTSVIKHEYILDLAGPACFSDTAAANCDPASLDPFAVYGTKNWPYTVGTPPLDTEFGTVGITLLCDENGSTGTATVGTGRINPFSRGMVAPNAKVFRFDGLNDDCDDAEDTPQERYAAIPSLVDGQDYQGITGTDPGTYAAIMSANNWLGYSGTITSAPVTDADNFFEVRVSVPNNQIAGTYAGTLILSCLPNLTAEPALDFDGPFGTPAWSEDDQTN